MRFVFTTILIIIFSYIGEIFCPWWIVAVASFVFAFMTDQKPWKAFLSGFVSIALLWASIALCKDISNAHLLSRKMAGLFHLPSYGSFIAVTSLIGALVGGFSAWSGILVRKSLGL